MKQSISFLVVFLSSMLTIIQFSCTNSNDGENPLDALLNSRRILLPNGWSLSVPGESIPLG